MPPAFDRRLTPARADLAAAHLRGQVEAPAYADPEPCHIAAPSAPLRAAPDAAGAWDSELLFGEGITIYDRAGQWAWGQSVLDGYVGYLPAAALGAGSGQPTHRVATLAATLYARPALKSPSAGVLGLGARVTVLQQTGGFARIGPDRWVARPQIAPLGSAPDWVGTASLCLGLPYVWGGRSGQGVDCSGLVQLALQAAGHDCPRDSDMQAAALGQSCDPGTPPRRGDLIFWAGHVGIMTDGDTLLHANAHHMAVAAEPLADATARIDAAGGGRPTRHARLDPGGTGR